MDIVSSACVSFAAIRARQRARYREGVRLGARGKAPLAPSPSLYTGG